MHKMKIYFQINYFMRDVDANEDGTIKYDEAATLILKLGSKF